MNTNKYMQTDSRWSELGYPSRPCYVGRDGCGMVSIANILIEMEQYAKYTPATIQPYCRQYAASNCDGTYWSGIPKMLSHYGLTEVKEHATMDSLWKELAKGNRVAVYMMGNTPGGSLRVHWTSGGHFIASVGYRYQNNDHQVYVKDSYSNSNLRNGWVGYKTHLKGDVRAVWSAKLVGKPAPTPVPPAPGKLVVDGICGEDTVKAMQKFFGLPQDGVISNQNRAFSNLYPSITAITYGKGGSKVVSKLQAWLKLSGPDGIIGKNTTRAWQKRLRDYGYIAKNETIDGIMGVKSMKAWQECLNNGCKPKGSPTPTPTPTPPTPTPTTKIKMIDVSDFQSNINWAKVKADGVKAVIIRCGGRGGEKGNIYEDTDFFANIKGAYKAGLSVGIYFLTQAINAKEGASEAQYTIKRWTESGIPISFPICIDSEDVTWKNPDGTTGYGRAHSKKLSKAKRTEAIKGFADECKRQGYKSMVYASTSYLEDHIDMSVLAPLMDVWVAQYYKTCQYKGKYIIWQYTSEGRVNGIKGDVDMDWCYVEPNKVDPPKPEPKPEPTPTPSDGHYQGKYPEVRVKRTNAQVIEYAIKWAKWIASMNDFHYGHGNHAHHNGCYFCNTQGAKKGHMKMWQTTYCCNPFVHAAWAHGGLIPKALSMCDNGKSWDFNKGSGYDASDLFDKLGKPAQSKLKAGDVLCSDSHVALYIGGGKVVQAGHEDDNVIGSSSWNSSISVGSWGGYKRAYRFNGKVDADIIIRKGEVSDRVVDLQRYLVWYGALPQGETADGIYGEKTFKAVVKMQTDFFGKAEADGTVGNKTISKMREVVR